MTNKTQPVRAEQEFFWEQLLDFIEAGSVIPIVGEGLLQVQPQGEAPTPLYTWLACRLAKKLGLSGESAAEELTEEVSLNEVACRFLRQRGARREDIYSALKLLQPEIEALEVPRPLRQLAEIGSLRLFVTTTFDPLLERVLTEARGGKAPRVLELSPEDPADLPADTARGTTLFYLFGRLSARPSYAVTEEDVLEFVHALQSQGRRPEELLDRMQESQLLILGSRFDDWLARFFLRSATRARLSLASGIDYLADLKALESPSLVRFLETFSSRLKLFHDGDAVQLVDELHRRWKARHSSADEDVEKATDSEPEPLEIGPNAVFLSYAREDLEVAQRLRDALDAEGIDVWFDQEDLSWGDRWKDKIARSIRDCQLFLPLVSRSSLVQRRRGVHAEWNLAIEEAQRASPTSRFLIPLLLDGISPEHPEIPPELQEAQGRAITRDGDLNVLAREVRELLRERQRESPKGIE